MEYDSLTSTGPSDVTLGPGLFRDRADLNRRYLLGLDTHNLLQNHYLEAGMGSMRQMRNTMLGDTDHGDSRHWGWESPTCQVRGHFLGHWMSAAARTVAATGDKELAVKLDAVIDGLSACQERNGGEWVFSIPEKYLHWTAAGRPTWAPHYVVHKTLMGLIDAYRYAGIDTALGITVNAAKWFTRWTVTLSDDQMADLLDVETGGMMEAWADLYGITGDPEHRALMDRYVRTRLFDPLLEGRDVLTNMHANTTIPEVHGACRAYEVTGDEKWLEIARSYWASAVRERGFFCTGGQTSGEIWTPPNEFTARRGDKNQEHCTVYNMIRLADFLFRNSGDPDYLDYIERNLYNGILAQQHPRTGMITYFLPLEGGAEKRWGSPTDDFWCCHGTLVQAHTLHNAYIAYSAPDRLVVAQYIPSTVHAEISGVPVRITITFDEMAKGAADDNSSAAGSRHRPGCWSVRIEVQCDREIEWTLLLRRPWWLTGDPTVKVNGSSIRSDDRKSGFITIRRMWHRDAIHVILPKGLTVSPIPDEPDTVAFLDGPCVLAGMCDREITLFGNKDRPDELLVPDNERQWGQWLSGYRTVGQPYSIRFKPLHEIIDEPYTVYFPIREG